VLHCSPRSIIDAIRSVVKLNTEPDAQRKEGTMSKKQILVLFLCGLVPWTIGNGMAPILPIYAAQMGASPAVVGNYFSFCYLALTIGTLGAGWFSDKLQRRKTLIVVAGTVSIPALWLMGRATNVWCLAALSAVFCFCVGVASTLINILAGLFAAEAARGRIFGILALTPVLGTLIGGFTAGSIADRWGFPTMFATVALFGILWPLTGSRLQDKTAGRVHIRRADASTVSEQPGLGGSFNLLLMASLAVGVNTYVAYLGRSWVMDDLGFNAAAISRTGAIAAAITLPLPAVIGWLSDRVGRKRLLALGYLAGTPCLLIMAVSVSAWHFWAALALMNVASAVVSVGSALVTDLVPQEALGRGLSLFNATTWVAGIVGSAGTGYAFQNFGAFSTFILGALLPLIAIVLLIPIRQAAQEKRSAAHSVQAPPLESLETIA